MPFLRFHAVDKQRLASVSKEMVDRIEAVVKCPREHIVLEVLYSDFVMDGKIVEGYPYVEVSYFERTLEVQDQVAGIICSCLKNAGYADSDVYFTYLVARNYYENGNTYKI